MSVFLLQVQKCKNKNQDLMKDEQTLQTIDCGILQEKLEL